MNRGSEQFGIQNGLHDVPTKMQKMMPPLVHMHLSHSVLKEMNQVQMQLRAPIFKPLQPTAQIKGPAQCGHVTAEGILDLSKSNKQEEKENRDRIEVKDRENIQKNYYRDSTPSTHDLLKSPRKRDHSSWSSRERQTNNDDNDNGVKPQPVIANNLRTHDITKITMSSGGITVPFSSTMQSMQTPMLNRQTDKTRVEKLVPGNVPNWLSISQQIQMSNKETYFKEGVILPRIPGSATPQRREKPSGCRTILVTGLPAKVTKDGITEIFGIFGPVDEVKLEKQGFARVRFKNPESVEPCLTFSGRRIILRGQSDNEALTLFIDYTSNNLDDQNENENDKNTGNHQPGPFIIKPFTASVMLTVAEQIKSDFEFCDAAPILANWLEYGECNKKNANFFYVLIRNSNNHLKRLVMEKTQLKDEYENLKSNIKEKFGQVIKQFEGVTKILTAAKHPRVFQNFTRDHREDIEMWYETRKEMDSIQDDFNDLFDKEERQRNMVSLAMYEKVKAENDKLTIEMEAYKNEAYKNEAYKNEVCKNKAYKNKSHKNEAHIVKIELEHQFEKLKAALSEHTVQMNKMVSSLPQVQLPAPSMPDLDPDSSNSQQPSSSIDVTSLTVNASEAKFISLLSVYLVVHPQGASIDHLVSYLESMRYIVTKPIILDVLLKYTDVFRCKAEAVDIPIQHKWFLKLS